MRVAAVLCNDTRFRRKDIAARGTSEGVQEMTPKAKQSQRDSLRDKAAKVDRYLMDGYSAHDAELMAEAEMELESGGKLDTK
jgi:hypothetical protein